MRFCVRTGNTSKPATTAQAAPSADSPSRITSRSGVKLRNSVYSSPIIAVTKKDTTA